jgi:cytochrome c oxidase cbb3-type subunit 3
MHRALDMKVFITLMTVFAILCGCDREERELRLDPPLAAALGTVSLMPNGIGGAPPEVYFALGQPYAANAYNLSEGKRLYSWFGCQGCHRQGEGGTGPAFLDGWWLYGPEIHSIFASIRDGRPHGMPAFRDKLTTEQVWQMSGYVRTIGSYSASTGAPGRDDAKQTRPAENRAPAAILFNEGPTPVHRDQGPSP